MEASQRTSSKNKGDSSSSAVAAASAEESGWTIYFEDFFASEKREEEEEEEEVGGCTVSINTSVGVGSSLVSDAASCAACKLPAAVAAAEASGGRRRLSFKKRKARGAVLDDDSLEDTASSPVNSPKISEMNHLSLNQRKKDENGHISQEKDTIVGFENCTEVRRDEIVDGANECTELKKRGLCLVPLSMLVDYLG